MSYNDRRRGRNRHLIDRTFLSPDQPAALSLTNRVSFPTKLYQMLEDTQRLGKESVVSWVLEGKAFRVHGVDELVDEIMPRYFRQTRYKSFQRQLHLYGFTRITKGKCKGAYQHPMFQRGDRELCKGMTPMKTKRCTPGNAKKCSDKVASGFGAGGGGTHADDKKLPAARTELMEGELTAQQALKPMSGTANAIMSLGFGDTNRDFPSVLSNSQDRQIFPLEHSVIQAPPSNRLSTESAFAAGRVSANMPLGNESGPRAASLASTLHAYHGSSPLLQGTDTGDTSASSTSFLGSESTQGQQLSQRTEQQASYLPNNHHLFLNMLQPQHNSSTGGPIFQQGPGGTGNSISISNQPSLGNPTTTPQSSSSSVAPQLPASTAMTNRRMQMANFSLADQERQHLLNQLHYQANRLQQSLASQQQQQLVASGGGTACTTTSTSTNIGSSIAISPSLLTNNTIPSTPLSGPYIDSSDFGSTAGITSNDLDVTGAGHRVMDPNMDPNAFEPRRFS